MDVSKLSDEQLEKLILQNKQIPVEASDITSLSDEELDKMISQSQGDSEFDTTELIGMGGGIGGALAGAAIGSAVPVVGTVLGGIVGGAIGTFGGELAEDFVDEKDLDFANATKEATIGVGIDIATLGTIKFAKPVYYASKRALGFTPKEVAEDLAVKIPNFTQKAGTPESLQATQELLQEAGGTLTPSQISSSNGILDFAEAIGRVGLVSGGKFDANAVKVNEAISGAIEDVVAKTEASVYARDTLGEAVSNVLSEAKSAIGKQYELGLDEVSALLKNKKVDAAPIYKRLDSLLKSKSIKLGGTSLQPESVAVLKSLLDDLSYGLPKSDDIMGVVSVSTGKKNPITNQDIMTKKVMPVGKKVTKQPIPAEHLLEWEKKVKQTLNELSNPKNNKMFSTTVHAQVSQVWKSLSKSVDDAIIKASPQAHKKYNDVKRAYGAGIETIRPEAIKSIMGNASKEVYDNLGGVLLPATGAASVGRFNKTWEAVKFASKQLDSKTLDKLGFKSSEDVLNTVKASYVQRFFPDMRADKFDLSKAARKMEGMTPEQLSQAKTVLGKDFPRFQQIKNAIIDASAKPKSDIGLLALRSREYQAGGLLVGAGVTVGSVAGGLATLLTPMVLAKVALNPKRSAKLINILKRQSGTPEGLSETQKRIALLIAEVGDVSVDEATQP